MKNIRHIIFLAVFPFAVFSQQPLPETEWEKTFGNAEWDGANSIIALNDGGFVVAGYTYSEKSKSDVWVLKLDIAGNVLWEKTFGGSNTDRATCIISLPDGGYIAGGYTSSKGAGNNDAWLLKLDGEGNLEWDRTYGAHKDEQLNDITLTSDGGYAATGFTHSKQSNGIAWIFKTDKDGNLEWDTAYCGSESGGGTPTDVGSAIIQTPDGGYAIAGHTRSIGAGDDDIWLLKLNGKGEKLWDRAYGSEKRERAYDIINRPGGGFLLAGYTEAGVQDVDALVLSIDESGKVQSDVKSGGHSREEAYSIAITADSGYVLAGLSQSNGPEYSGMWVVKMAQDLKVQWEKPFKGSPGSSDVIYCIAPTPDGGFAAAGEIWSKGAGKSDMWVAKSEGELLKSIDWYVKQKMTPWLQKGEFEKTAAHQERISGANMEKVKEKYRQEAVNYYGAKKIKLEDATLSKYNADNETFTIGFPDFKSVEVNVPMNEAQSFSQNWEYVEFQLPVFDLIDNRLILSRTVMDINGKGYSFTHPAPGAQNQNLFFEFTGETKKDVYRGSGDPLKGLNISKAKSIETGKYYALLIGIDDYKGQWTPLNNAVKDARAVENMIRNKYQFNHFKTIYNEEATRENIINGFLWLVENVKENDNVFIYYSGHGEFNQKLNKGYWVPVDAQTESISIYLSNSDIQTFLSGIKAKHTLLVSDACFSGDIFRGNTVSVPFDNTDKYYMEVYKLKSCQAISSGGIEPVMDGGKDGHSVFAYYFLKELNENTSQYLDAGRLFEKIKVPVVNNSDQSPKFQPVKDTGDEGGQFVFIRK